MEWERLGMEWEYHSDLVNLMDSLRNKPTWMKTAARRMYDMGVGIPMIKIILRRMRKTRKALLDKQRREARAARIAADHGPHSAGNPTAE